MSALKLTLVKIAKDFNRRHVFHDISFTLESGESLAITGRNGSGKSTLVKVIAGVLTPSAGEVCFEAGGRMLETEAVKHRLGFVSPYLQLYDEFSADENLDLLSRIRANGVPEPGTAEKLLEQFNLFHRRRDPVRTFSSGMKQRLKYVFALLHQPDLLILDEQT
ncbi:MAG: ABC transporter ATP-binding protein, partial [Bacteroidota bacterium]